MSGKEEEIGAVECGEGKSLEVGGRDAVGNNGI